MDFIDTLEWWRCSCFQRFSQSCPGVGESVRCSWRCWSVTHCYLEWNREKVGLLSHGEVSPPSSVSTLLMSRRVNQPQVWPISPWLLVSRCSLLVSSGRSSEPPPKHCPGPGRILWCSRGDTRCGWGVTRYFASDRPRGHLRGLLGSDNIWPRYN